ncbi:hypothetical protein D3C87_325360 [compost metagenome]
MFYTYRQNNSGGNFVVDDSVTYNVIIESNNAAQANTLAQSVGLYFGGGWDCPCCGDRWSSAWDDEGDAEPMVYGTPVKEYKEFWARGIDPQIYVYYLDGRKETY